MFHNYGGCAVFIKVKLPSLDVTDYNYTVTSGGVVTLTEYIGDNTNVVVPIPFLPEGE